ncbi:hypothetical protein NPIL_479991, partial [Nephila pilipes]
EEISRDERNSSPSPDEICGKQHKLEVEMKELERNSRSIAHKRPADMIKKRSTRSDGKHESPIG